MNIEQLIILLAIGAAAGWLAGFILNGGGFGLVANMVIGVIGSVLGGVILGALGLSIAGGLVGSIINATIGAVALLLVIKVIRKA
jgi:uncharacterized membrane protein YeaQ/YmgE (transglycosylase-associated protein family)